jgi:5S rRNA maturation endonuclease (ribonuclease M5)
MFEDSHVGGLSIPIIIQGQDSVFNHYLGSFPNELDRFHSPFRSDSNPGCRFEYSNGIWWFIDNATYKNRLRFNCIHFVQCMFEIGYQEAANKISEEVVFSKDIFPEPQIFIPEIKVKLQTMPLNNHFTQYGLPNEYLESQTVGSVKYYYANTRKHNYLKLNAYYTPAYQQIYCYFIGEKIELYFPGADIKFVKETLGSDYYGDNNEEDYVIVVEGNLDRMVFEYHSGLNVIGLQNVYALPELFNKKIIVLLDPDDAGMQGAARILKKYPESINLTSFSNEYDIADMYKFNKEKFNNLINECRKIVDPCQIKMQ